MQNKQIKKGEIYSCNLSDKTTGSVQTGTRPVIIIQNDTGNLFSTTTIVVPLTTSNTKAKIPTHFFVHHKELKNHRSLVLCEQIFTIDKSQLISKVTQLTEEEMKELNRCLKISLALS